MGTAVRRIFAALLLCLIIASMVLAPEPIKAELSRDRYSEWMQIEKEPTVLIINVWHIVSFKPYVGSLGNWLQNRAEEYRTAFVGIYFRVLSLTPEQAQSLRRRGDAPDVISFAGGSVSSDSLLPLDTYFGDLIGGLSAESGYSSGILYALPYCATGQLLLYTQAAATIDDEELLTASGTAEQFRNGKAQSTVCDIRGAGEMYRAGLMGKAPYFEAVPITTKPTPTQLIQYLAVSRSIDERKVKYALGFIEYTLSVNSQSKLSAVGLLPVNTDACVSYDVPWLTRLYNEFDPFSIEGCFNGNIENIISDN